MRNLKSLVLALAMGGALLGFGACAQGTSDDPPARPDAPLQARFDAPLQQDLPDAPSQSFPDAPVSSPADANIPPQPDANLTGQGEFGDPCASDNDCDPTAALCCFIIQQPGTCVPLELGVCS